MWKIIIDIIKRHQRFLVTTHVHPDGDGLGAASALADLLIRQGKEARIVCEGRIPPKFHFLNFHGFYSIFDPEKDWSWVEVVVVLDTHVKKRMGRISQIVEKENVITICIDHHTITDELFTPYTIVDPEACSVGAMIYNLIKFSGYPLTLEAAIGIYTSIVCDTGRFSYPSTTGEAHRIADECITIGVNPDTIHRALYHQVPIEHIQAFVAALRSLEICMDGQALFLVLNHDAYKVGNDFEVLEHLDLDYVHEFLKQAAKMECAVLFRELPGGKVRISGRSKSFVDVGKLMRTLGGGGHARAAGVTFMGSIADAKELVLAKLHEQLYHDDNQRKIEDFRQDNAAVLGWIQNRVCGSDL